LCPKFSQIASPGPIVMRYTETAEADAFCVGSGSCAKAGAGASASKCAASTDPSTGEIRGIIAPRCYPPAPLAVNQWPGGAEAHPAILLPRGATDLHIEARRNGISRGGAEARR
jgi:hypothetical protein